MNIEIERMFNKEHQAKTEKIAILKSSKPVKLLGISIEETKNLMKEAGLSAINIQELFEKDYEDFLE